MDKAVPVRGERGQKGECSVLTGTEGASHDQPKQEKMSSWVLVQLILFFLPVIFVLWIIHICLLTYINDSITSVNIHKPLPEKAMQIRCKS